MKIIGMSREELLGLAHQDVGRHFLTSYEIIYIAKTLGAFWQYDYEAAKKGRVGMHALLKSGQHSDGFFISRILLESENIREIIAHQMVMKIEEAEVPIPDYVTGIPKGATELGFEVSKIMGTEHARMEKIGGRIKLTQQINPGDSILLVEDFCTRGTGFAEGVASVIEAVPEANILRYDPVIINRGGLEMVSTVCGDCRILPVVEMRIQDWDPEVCPLCKAGSRAIKPKETNENWAAINSSQKE
jgi:orotate phosphoribosyltransferase